MVSGCVEVSLDRYWKQVLFYKKQSHLFVLFLAPRNEAQVKHYGSPAQHGRDVANNKQSIGIGMIGQSTISPGEGLTGGEPPVQQLLSRLQIEQRLAQHARAIDRADEVLLRTAYHDDGTVDYGSLQGTAAEFASAIAGMHQNLPMSLHRPSNAFIQLAGDRAVSESYVIAWVTLPTDGEPQPHWVGGRYLDTHTRKNGEWRMQHRHYVLEWIMQFPEPGPSGCPPAFNLQGLVPLGGHHLQDPGNALLLAYAADHKESKETTAMNDAEALDRVISHQAIIELGCKYARGVDRGDPDTIMEAFHEDASILAGVFNGPAKAFAVEVTKTLDTVSPRVMHSVSNHWVDINGDSAVGESYVLAYQCVVGAEPQDVLTGGRYIDKYERRDGVWKIAQRSFVMDWTTSSPSKNLLESGMFEGMTQGQRGKSDPVFALWNSLS